MSVANPALVELGEPTPLRDPQTGLLSFTRRFKLAQSHLTPAQLTAQAWQAEGTADGAFTDGFVPKPDRVYSDCILVEQSVAEEETGPGRVEYVLRKRYQELHATEFTTIGEIELTVDESGLLVAVESLIGRLSLNPEVSILSSKTVNGIALLLSGSKITRQRAFQQVTRTYRQPGVLAITPNVRFSGVDEYTVVTQGRSLQQLLDDDVTVTLPDGQSTIPDTALVEAPRVSNASGFPTFTQDVYLFAQSFESGEKLISTRQAYVDVSIPGVVNVAKHVFSSSEFDEDALLYPQTQPPKTVRRKARIDRVLSFSGDLADGVGQSDRLVAYNPADIDWADLTLTRLSTRYAGINLYDGRTLNLAYPIYRKSSSISQRAYPGYLAGTNEETAREDYTLPQIELPEGFSPFAPIESEDYKALLTGDTSIAQTGLYSVDVEEFARLADGTMVYLKTRVTLL